MGPASRPSSRRHDEMRRVSLEPGVLKHAEGSCLVKFGDTHVLCTASLENQAPSFLRGSGRGWVTAEYGMLPRATSERTRREAAAGKQSGRTQEIQRLIGRSLRAVTALDLLGERQIIIDCDVLQADGGTRTAAITGGFVALYQCVNFMTATQLIARHAIKDHVAAISCGMHQNAPVLDLDYAEDSGPEPTPISSSPAGAASWRSRRPPKALPSARPSSANCWRSRARARSELMLLQKEALKL